MIGAAEIDRRFSYHPADKATGEDLGRVRSMLREVAGTLDVNLPDGREKSTAITKLEEAMFWANAALARPAAIAPSPVAPK